MNQTSNILIVDDEEVVRRAHLRSLEQTGCRARAAENGYEAIRVMEEHPFDVVLLDLRMPGLNGMDVLKTIKDRWPECEVVVITGYPTIESAKEAVRLGAFNYIVKPVGPDDVVKAANDAMIQKRWTLHSAHPDRGSEHPEHTGRRRSPVTH
ncbi:MAG: response regulator [Xanthomonadales bacterium]|nr:response regulator [Xanthomonadales bacterium]